MTFSIFIHPELSSEACPIEELKNVIVHELLHTCPRCLGHGKTWMKYAKIVNEKYGYEVSTVKDHEDIFHKEKPVLLRLVCKSCGSFNDLRTVPDDYCDGYSVCPFCNSEYEEIRLSNSLNC